MNYTAMEKEFINKSIICFIQSKDKTEADIRRDIIMYLNNDPNFFTDEQLVIFENLIQEVYHPNEKAASSNE